MSLSRRALFTSVPLTALAVGASLPRTGGTAAVPTPAAVPTSAADATTAIDTRLVAQVTRRQKWLSGVVGTTAAPFSRWRGSPVRILGLYADASVAAQTEQYQFTHNTFTGDIDLAVGGPIDRTWAQAAKGSERSRWIAMARQFDKNWRCRTLYLRYAHEANGTWMKWSVKPAEVAAFRATFRLFATTMRRELRGHQVKIVFAPNFGSWRYPVETMWPGNDVVDVVGLSLYEWDTYNTEAKWRAFNASTIGPEYWRAFAARHRKPLALSEWGARSPFFLGKMNAWLATHGGTGSGRLLYDVYMNKEQFELTGALATRYKSLTWGS